jgi:hypothetical protein
VLRADHRLDEDGGLAAAQHDGGHRRPFSQREQATAQRALARARRARLSVAMDGHGSARLDSLW